MGSVPGRNHSTGNNSNRGDSSTTNDIDADEDDSNNTLPSMPII